jgi:hypothetical protein
LARVQIARDTVVCGGFHRHGVVDLADAGDLDADLVAGDQVVAGDSADPAGGSGCD